MTPISRTLNVIAYQSSLIKKETAHGKSKKTTVINLANFDFPSCKGLVRSCAKVLFKILAKT